MKTLLVLFALTLLLACGGGGGTDGSASTGGTFTVATVTSGLTAPTAMTLAPDGRVFICEQGGTLRIVKDGVLQAAPFLTANVDSTGERGLLGVALDPAFATNGFVYVYYTATTPNVHNRVSRFTAVGDLAETNSETILLDLDPLSLATNHNGGGLHFGPDGKLYLGVGENAFKPNAQDPANLLGKLVRMEPNGLVPTDNPFVGQYFGKNQLIWALGLRNPSTFAFQPGTGRLFINDVGENLWEEVNVGQAGANYDWPNSEGYTQNHTSPLFAYPHSGAAVTGCAIVGAAFYDPTTRLLPASFVGKYLFMDFCEGWIRTLDPDTKAVGDFVTGFSSPVDLLVVPDGSVLVLSRGDGTLKRVT